MSPEAAVRCARKCSSGCTHQPLDERRLAQQRRAKVLPCRRTLRAAEVEVDGIDVALHLPPTALGQP